MQELRLVAVSEDGSYAILAVPGRSGRFLLPIDERLRTVAKGQFSRLAQYEIEVENPLRPKEIQDRIRAGETADEIADAAGIPPDRIRRFEGPILAERQYQAQQAQRATIRGHTDSGGPGPRLGDIVADRLTKAGASAENAEWDSRKRQDGNWQIQLRFSLGSRTGSAEWIYDPRRRHVIPDDDQAVRLCLPQADWSGVEFADQAQPRATVTSISARHVAHGEAGRDTGTAAGPTILSRDTSASGRSRDVVPAAASADPQPATAEPATAAATEEAAAAGASQRRPEPAHPARKAAGGRGRRSSVPSWDEIMFGTSRQSD
jgi:Protein of unknown function (DUF3071)